MESVRLDVWLWAARFYKTRSQAKQACDSNHVLVNDETAKPARLLRLGDVVSVKLPESRRVARILALADTRGPPPVARLLYDDQSPPPVPRSQRVAPREPGAGRPTKRDRRVMQRWREG